MDNVIIEVLKEDDIDEYSALINEVMNEFNKEEVDDYQIWFAGVEGINERRSWNSPNYKFATLQFTAKIGGKIIGALEIANADHIQSFFVKKEYQKMGIGKKLFNFSKKFFINNGIKLYGYGVYASNYAINFYKKLGFMGDGKHLYLEISYRRTERVQLMYNIFLRRLTGLWQMRRRNRATRANLKYLKA
jgi:ribosomal protein S18 acetylase RimI-like enzyme